MNELYKSLSLATRKVLSAYEEQLIVPVGLKLVSEGVIPEHLIAIQQGSVEVSMPAWGGEISLSVAVEGQILGLGPIVSETLPEIDVTTLEECRIFRIPKEAFLQVLQQHPDMYFAIAKVLAADLNTPERFLRIGLRAANWALPTPRLFQIPNPLIH